MESAADVGLRASDSHGSGSAFNFLCRLNQHTQRATASGQEVVQEGTVDSFSLADLGSDLRHEEDVRQWNERRQSTQQATVSDRLGVLSSGVTVAEIRYKASTTVIKAAEQPVRPIF